MPSLSGSRLDNRTPNGTCLVIWAADSVRIENVHFRTSYPPVARDASELDAEVRQRAKFATVNYRAAPQCTGGAELGGGPQGRQPCAPGRIIDSRAGCAVEPDFTAGDPQPALPARYTTTITWSLSKGCTDAASGPCARLQGGVQPSSGRPVRAFWQVTTTVASCVLWIDYPEGVNRGEGVVAQCPGS
ncbi:hypothetical protein DPM19_04095 [Actinomadura craniellae]|uniref:Uncharacterized protein n=1 Tax=Actinomadura craniellae TaxID=2231787 RepID=A0A365HAJ1_9ACTN|nr:hypothetical protein DPM19_04095 [Actinomadura craniellae]